jgi:hypothetical protein
LDKGEQLKKMSPEQRVVKANELHMCLTCLRHTVDKECYAKGKEDFKGCSEGVVAAWNIIPCCTGPSSWPGCSQCK